jgi:hypothetical protein
MNYYCISVDQLFEKVKSKEWRLKKKERRHGKST